MANSFVVRRTQATGGGRPKRSWRCRAVLVLFGLACVGCQRPCTPTPSAYISAPLHPQENAYWCWAATAHMVMDAMGHPVTQCEIANRRLSRSDCLCNGCDNLETPPNCLSAGWPPFEEFGFESKRTVSSALSWLRLKSQLSAGPACRQTPVVFSWRWPGGGAHTMVAIGYSTDPDGERLVHILDPWQPCEGHETIISYDEYEAMPGHHAHGRDYYDIRYQGEEG